jgi:hypothetical protein
VTGPRLLAEDLVLAGLDPAARGRIMLGPWPDVLVDAATIIDLVRAGRVAVTGEGKNTRVVVVDPRPVEQPVLREALGWLVDVHAPPTAADHAELEAAGWLTKKIIGLAGDWTEPGEKLSKALSGHYARRRLLEHMVSSGLITTSEHRTLGLRPKPRHTPTPLAQRDQLVADLRAVLLDGREPNQRTGPLISLLSLSNLAARTVDGAANTASWGSWKRRREMNQRASVIAQAEWDADGFVRATIAGTGAHLSKLNESSS